MKTSGQVASMSRAYNQVWRLDHTTDVFVDSPITVSYTHLDVYKRQAIRYSPETQPR